MSRPGWAELTIGRMSRKIESLEQNIQALKRRNEVLKQIISDICDITGLEHPDLRYERYVPVSRARQDEDNEQEETVPDNREVTELRNDRKKKNCHLVKVKKKLNPRHLRTLLQLRETQRISDVEERHVRK